MMWTLTVYHGDTLILEHSQNDYSKVLKFALNSVVELVNGNAPDFRIVMVDKDKNVYFSATGEKTQIIGMRKNGARI